MIFFRWTTDVSGAILIRDWGHHVIHSLNLVVAIDAKSFDVITSSSFIPASFIAHLIGPSTTPELTFIQCPSD